MQEELKERFKDMQDDAQLARDEVASLLRQRDEWTETKSAFEQTIVDLHHREGERDEQDRQRQAESQRHSEEIQGLEQRLREADQRERDRQQQIASLEGEIQRMREGEEQLKETLRKTRVALSKEKTRVEQYRIAAANPVAMMASPTSQQQQPPTAASAEPNEDDDAGSQQTAETRRDGPYVLQQDMISSPARGVPVIDLDDEEVRPAVMRTLVPSVTRLAEIEAIHAANPPRGDERLVHSIVARAPPNRPLYVDTALCTGPISASSTSSTPRRRAARRTSYKQCLRERRYPNILYKAL